MEDFTSKTQFQKFIKIDIRKNRQIFRKVFKLLTTLQISHANHHFMILVYKNVN